jgi:hypothetical protein
MLGHDKYLSRKLVLFFLFFFLFFTFFVALRLFLKICLKKNTKNEWKKNPVSPLESYCFSDENGEKCYVVMFNF